MLSRALWAVTVLVVTCTAACKKPPKCIDPDRDDMLRLQEEYNAGRDPCPALAAPKLTLNAQGLALDGARLAAKAELPTGTVHRVDALFAQLKARRELWKQIHPAQTFAATVDAEIADDIDAMTAASVLQTAAFAGYPTIHIRGGAAKLDVVLFVPGPPSPSGARPQPLRVTDAASVGQAIASQCPVRCDVASVAPHATFGETAKTVEAVLSAPPYAGNPPQIALW